MGTVAEAGLLHFRGAYHDPFMYLPVTVPPARGRADRRRSRRSHARAAADHAVLAAADRRCSASLGAGFHAMGVARNMGGWRNWRQNLLNGPPIPAPPSFTGLALAGLAALGLMQDHPDD